MFDRWMAELQTKDVSGCSRPELADLVAASSRLRDALDAFDARLATAVDQLGDNGAGSSVVIRSAARCSQREADRRARRSAGLAALPDTADALAAGEITAEHVDGLLRAAEATSTEAVAASDLLSIARQRPADLLARDVREWTRRHQTQQSLEEQHARRRAARRCVIFDNDLGMTVLHAEFDPIAGASVKAALNRACDRLFTLDGGRGQAGETRTVEQRRADALAALLTGDEADDAAVAPGASQPASGKARTTPRKAPVRTQMLVIAQADGSAEIPGVGPIPASELAKLYCTSDIFGLVFSTEGQPLWHGTAVRLADDNQWRALVARDGSCVICAAHPPKCEAHHIEFAGPPSRGPTDIDNLALLCSHHHHLVHDLGYRLERRSDGSWTLIAPDQGTGGP